MKKAIEKNSDSKPDVDKAKRVYRAALDAIRKLDEILQQKKGYRDVFLQDAVGLRNKLKEYCERLMFYNPAEYGRKAEEVLWRKVFYDTIQLVKKNRRHVRPGSSLEAAFRTHLAGATGYYNHLLFRLQTEFGLCLHGILDLYLMPDTKPGLKKSSLVQNSRRKDVTPAVLEWANKACHRTLICLGDIARYQQEFDRGLSRSAAQRYYHKAIVMCPDNGMPHNQLGTLSGMRYFQCEAAYHYIRCMVCEKPFEGAEGNLDRLFEKNRKRFREIQQMSSSTLAPELQRQHDVKFFLIHFLHLLDVFFDANKRISAGELQDSCQSALQSFNLCMFYKPDLYAEEDSRDENLQYLDDDLVFKLVIMCMATIHLLQIRGSKHVTAATAFLLALFSHILNHVVIRLHGALYERENPNKLLNHQIVQNGEELSDVDSGEMCNGPSEGNDRQDKLTSGRDGEGENTSKQEGNKPEQVKGEGVKKNIIQQKNMKSSRVKNLRRRRMRCRDDSSDSSGLSDVSDLSEGDDHLSDTFLSEESEEEEEFVGFFAHDSDSDLSDNLMESQELEPGFSAESALTKSGKDERVANVNSNHTTDRSSHQSTTSVGSQGTVQNDSSIWTSEKDYLAHFSSELLTSSSTTLLGQNFKLSTTGTKTNDLNVQEMENCQEVMQGKRQVPVPPGFAQSSEARHVAEITDKLANFVIETDTEASIIPTDAEQSGCDESTTEADDQGSTTESAEGPETEHRFLQNTLDAVQSEGLLAIVKVMCDWMKCNTGVIMTCAQSSQSLWHRLSVLLNILPKETVIAEHDQCWLDELKTVLTTTRHGEWMQVFPLREDINLWLFTPLSEAHNLIEFSNRRRGQLSEIQECFLRIGCLRQFGHFLSELENLMFRYDTTLDAFIGPSQPVSAEENQREAMDRLAHEESRRNQLMRDMAQLRLQAEVSQLEGSLEKTDYTHFPPYLIPDTRCLCESLSFVRQLVQTGKGIIIIPLSVIDTLDFMKKDSVGARDAIRWLEAEFRKGNRYIRAQKSNEKHSENIPKNLKKTNREAWCVYEMVACARYLAQQGGDISTANMVAILSIKNLQLMPYPQPLKKALANCQQAGISLENVPLFTNKWKDLLKSNG
ncbi:hypothetical protein FSP39_014736 [Pinctada imbricata]|uniref:Protein SMG5 n=1 Tax=Pinctada imbricata TaxID=66713 RepID=A0AA88Y9D3_PINIB|nr:hypothetical protein FSP39_014736 [Pinctada imbricata]